MKCGCCVLGLIYFDTNKDCYLQGCLFRARHEDVESTPDNIVEWCETECLYDDQRKEKLREQLAA